MRVVVAALAIAVAARVAVPVPLSPVPVTLQSLAVLLVGFWLGPRRGTVAMLLYVAAAALGLPVLADGRGGWDAVTGPSLGYLAGFAATPAVLATLGRRRLVGALAAHAAILALGMAWLVVLGLSPGEAWARGALPFLPGMVLKSAVAALVARTGIRTSGRAA